MAAFGQSIARLHQLCSAAVSILGKVMLDSATPPATRVRAADSILDHTTKAIEIEDIERRVSELEQTAKDQGRTGKRKRSETMSLLGLANYRPPSGACEYTCCRCKSQSVGGSSRCPASGSKMPFFAR
jgi:hypothetical protein